MVLVHIYIFFLEGPLFAAFDARQTWNTELKTCTVACTTIHYCLAPGNQHTIHNLPPPKPRTAQTALLQGWQAQRSAEKSTQVQKPFAQNGLWKPLKPWEILSTVGENLSNIVLTRWDGHFIKGWSPELNDYRPQLVENIALTEAPEKWDTQCVGKNERGFLA